MKYFTVLSCLAAVVLSSLPSQAWQDPGAGRSDARYRGVRSYGHPVDGQPAAEGYRQGTAEVNRQWQAYHKAQARSMNPQHSDRAYHVSVPRSQAVNPTGHGHYGAGYVAQPVYQYPEHHNPYYSEQSQRDIIVEMLDWFLSIPASVVSRFSEAGNEGVYPRMPATHGSGYGQGNHYAAYSHQQSDEARFVPPRSAYESARPRQYRGSQD